MSQRILQLTALFCALSAQAQNVFVTPPGDGVARPVLPFTGDSPTFSPAATTVTAAQDTFQVLSTPSGNKFYFIGRSGTDTVVVTDANYQVVARRNIGLGATSAAMTPDGRFLFIAGGQNSNLQVLRTADDSLATQVDAGGAIDVAISRDGLRAFAVNNAGRVTAIDVNTFAIAGTQNLTAGIGGIAVSPAGLIYVAAQNALYELEYANTSGAFTLRGGQQIGLNGVPGKPYVIAEGLSGARVAMVNTSQFPGSAAVFNVDLNSRSLANLTSPGIVLDRLIPVSFTKAYALSNSQQLYLVDFAAGTILPANFTGFPGAGVRGAAASNEFPNAKYLYAASAATNSIARIDVATGAVSPLLPLTSLPGGVSYAGAAATGTPAKVYTFNNGQSVPPGAQSFPLILRAVNAGDKPLSGVPVQCSITSTTGGQISSASASTDGEGYAQVVAVAPLLLGTFQVTCNVGSGVVVAAQFNLSSGTGGGPGQNTSGTVSVKGGNGQVIRETGITPESLRVVVRDANNNPLPNVVVRWGVITANGPTGQLTSLESTTDNFGEATNSYIAPFLGSFLLTGYVQATVTAATANNQVNLYVTVIPNQFSGNTVPLPTVQVLKPIGVDTISGQAGTTVAGAIQAKVTVGAGPAVGAAIPNVSINVTTGLDPTVGPTASCAQDAGKGLSDATGIATCDVVIGGRTGRTPMAITLGGQTVSTLNLEVGFGLPGKITIVQGNNQTGPAGAQLPLALVAEIQDSFGNILPGAEVRWTVESGTATIVNPITRGDTTGRVSALVRLGAAPGPVRVRITAVNGTATATEVYNLTVTGGVVQLRTLSGDAQSTTIGQAFSQPLVAQVIDSNNQPVPGVQVNFTVRSGQASLSPATAVSDAQGQVRTIATAGIQTGTVTVAAEFGGNTALFNLTVRTQGPSFTADSVTNAASGQRGIAPGAIVTIRGTNFATNVRGYVLPQSPTGPLPTTLSGVSVQFGGVPAPIFWVANVNGAESVTVQVPFEVPDNGSVPLTVTSSGASNSATVQITPTAPGIFEDVDGQGRRYAVATRADGTFITPDNPIGKGERGTVLITGLGKTSGQSYTNAMGAGDQRPIADIAFGFNNAGGNLISVEYARGLIGVYALTFEVPTGAPSGSVPIAVSAGGVFGNGSSINVR